MSNRRRLPFNAWLWGQATSETIAAGFDPVGVGRWWREQRLQRVLRAAAKDSPYYRKRLQRRGIDPDTPRVLSDFEPVTKKELMRHFDDWSTDRRITRAAANAFVRDPDRLADAFLGDYMLWTSSGTSGEPGIFVQDQNSLAAYDTIETVRLRGSTVAESIGTLAQPQRYAFIGATGGHFAGNASLERIRRGLGEWMPGMAPAVAMLSVLEPIEAIVEALEYFRPTVLVTYPTCADALAMYQAEGRLNIDIQEVWVGGEQLSHAQRDRIRAAFGCKIRNNYGASEFYIIACECPHGHLHVNDDWVLLEPVDANLKPVERGEHSTKVLLTNLANRTQPLVRYVLEDRIRQVIDRVCPCGSLFPWIEVQGRSDDTLTFEDGRGRSVPVLAMGLSTAIEEEAGITHFQVQQLGPRAIELRFESNVTDPDDAFRRCKRVIQGFLRQHGLSGIDVKASGEQPRMNDRSGKLRRVRAA